MSTEIEVPDDLKSAGRKFGYGIAIAINAVLLFVVNNILAWGWFGFLTEEFADVVPWITFSLAVSLLTNVVYLFNDTTVVKSSGQLISNVVALVATYQVFRVFPFDFSGYDFDWGIVVRIVLIVGMVGAGIGVVVEAVKLVGAARSVYDGS